MANAHPGTTSGIDISAHTFPCMEENIIPTHTIVQEADLCVCVCVYMCVCMCVFVCVCYECKGEVLNSARTYFNIRIAVCQLTQCYSHLLRLSRQVL